MPRSCNSASFPSHARFFARCAHKKSGRSAERATASKNSIVVKLSNSLRNEPIALQTGRKVRAKDAKDTKGKAREKTGSFPPNTAAAKLFFRPSAQALRASRSSREGY
jgi:hypothetical protein